MPNPRRLTIGRLAELSSVNLETIRYYERIGLMPAPGRSEGGHRSYAPAHRQRLTFIRRARALGFSIGEIRALLDLAASPDRACEEVRPIAEAHLADVRAKLTALRRMERVLAATVRQCANAATAPACPLLEALEDEGRPSPHPGEANRPSGRRSPARP
ncbi:MAG TPA: helix-turn-helix domain-containing protein [Caulobacteraceae bacterium]|nr:helix-turn-helix domain-containing protein [Caulobacteraceae bacterium]